jgi:23S rRNA (adenine2503-C2)-methyltransferase
VKGVLSSGIMMRSIHDDPGLQTFARETRLGVSELRDFRIGYFKRGLSGEALVATLPEAARRLAAKSLRQSFLELERRVDSEIDGASKLIFRTESGRRIETVILRPNTGRSTVCVSSQVGCAAACRFCATGTMGLVAQLSRDEILDQVVQARRIVAAEGRELRNVVFMGMGEPLHNVEAVSAALEGLSHPLGLNFSPAKVLVSTVGVPEAMRAMLARFPKFNLALSLHAARPEVRTKIVPTAERVSLDELRAVLVEASASGRRTMIEYVLLDGVNDRDADMRALSAWCQGLDVHLNFIPFNDVDAPADLRSTPRERREEIAREMKAEGFPVTLRYSLGADIAAACGQLVREGR